MDFHSELPWLFFWFTLALGSMVSDVDTLSCVCYFFAWFFWLRRAANSVLFEVVWHQKCSLFGLPQDRAVGLCIQGTLVQCSIHASYCAFIVLILQ